MNPELGKNSKSIPAIPVIWWTSEKVEKKNPYLKPKIIQ